MKRAACTLVFMIVAGCGARTPTLTVAPGLHPQMEPAAVELIARDAIASSIAMQVGGKQAPDAVSITAIHGGSTIAAYETGTSWLVEFNGWFEVADGGRSSETHIVRTATVQVADDYGTVLAVSIGGPVVR